MSPFDEKQFKEKKIPPLERPPVVEKEPKEPIIPEKKKEEEIPAKKYPPPQVRSREVKQVEKKTEIAEKIDNILSQDLDDFIQSLSSQEKERFQAKKEETIGVIEKMINQAKVVGREILNLIKKLLNFLPGMDRFFREKESKIKTDQILSMINKRKQL